MSDVEQTGKRGFFGEIRDVLVKTRRPEAPVEAVAVAAASAVETPQTQVAEVPAPVTVTMEAPIAPAEIAVPLPIEEQPLMVNAPMSMVEMPTAEAPQAEEVVETDPMAKVREVAGYLETIKRAMADLQGGNLTPEAKKAALQSAARANMEIRRLPPELLDLFVNARAVAGQNPNFSMDDFQREMVAAAKLLMGGKNV